jgi:hypothetical protein
MTPTATAAAAMRIANIIHQAVKRSEKYLRDDQRAAYPLTGDVWIVVKCKRIARKLKDEDWHTTADGSVAIRKLDEKRVKIVAHKFCRASKLWNGPDVLKNNELASMFASLFHDLLWVHKDELAEMLGITVKDVLYLANDAFVLAWRFIDPSLLGRVKSYFAFQAVSAAVPWYHRLKGATAAIAASVLLSGCSGCYSLPDGEVEEAGGVETVQQIMDIYGDGLGPDIEEDGE